MTRRLFLLIIFSGASCIAATNSGPCEDAIRQHTVCEAANQRAVKMMRKDHLTAITVMQDVKTGSLIELAASDPAKLDVNSAILPLSTVKLMLAASYWDHDLPDPPSADAMSVKEMIVTGNDYAGRRLASALRKAIGTKAVLADLGDYGFADKASAARVAASFWSELRPGEWKERLAPAATCNSLDDSTPSGEWEDTLSLGEKRFDVTALTLSRFLQAVGNDGVMLRPSAWPENDGNFPRPIPPGEPVRIMQVITARRLQAAMRDVVERGTAKSASGILKGTGWQIGGKTGTGPGPNPPGRNSDGCFAGLVFDPNGIARFTVVTFVNRGGLGGGHAARISAELARFLGHN